METYSPLSLLRRSLLVDRSSSENLFEDLIFMPDTLPARMTAPQTCSRCRKRRTKVKRPNPVLKSQLKIRYSVTGNCLLARAVDSLMLSVTSGMTLKAKKCHAGSSRLAQVSMPLSLTRCALDTCTPYIRARHTCSMRSKSLLAKIAVHYCSTPRLSRYLKCSPAISLVLVPKLI